MRLHVNALGAVMGGAARHLPPFLGALADVRPTWEVVVWVTGDGAPGSTSGGHDVRTVPRLSARRRLGWELQALPRAMRREGADALLNLTNSGPLRGPVPSVLYQRNALWFDPSWVRQLGVRDRAEAQARRQLAYLQMRRSAATIVPSAAMAGYLLGWPGAPSAPTLRVVSHGVDPDRFRNSVRSWPPAGRPVRLLSISHGSRHKDQLLLIRLVARLRDEAVDAVLRLTVDESDAPEYVAELERERRRLRLHERVEMLGRTVDVERLYRDADIMVYPSLTESFGLPVVEAMAAGVPVVASAIGASRELLGRDGWYFEPGDLDGAARAVRALLAAPATEVAAATARATLSARQRSWTRNATEIAQVVEAVQRRPVDV